MLSPIVERELRVALRKRPLHKARMWAAAVGAGICVIFLLNGLMEGTRAWGRSLHHYLFYAALFYSVVVPMRTCVRFVSEERRGNTLELLSLTGIRTTQFLGGKAIGGLLVASCELLALTPFMAMPFLAGGISLEVFLATLAALPTLLFLSVAIALLASVICSRDGEALLVAIAIACLLSLATPSPYALGKSLTGSPPFSAGWLCLSPGYAALLVATNFTYGTVHEFWAATGVTWLWTLLLFLAAGLALHRQWQSAPDRKTSSFERWRERLFRGTPEWRWKLRWQLLERNPFQWLAQRERRPMVIAWFSLGCIVAIWLLGWMMWPRAWPSVFNFFITATLLLVLERTVATHAAARRIAEDRRESHFELLLTTALSPVEILDGQLRASREQFRPLRLAIVSLFAIMVVWGVFLRAWTIMGILTYAVVWFVLTFWCLRKRDGRLTLVVWLALNSGRSAFAVLRSQGKMGWWYWIWMFFNLRRVASGMGSSAAQFPTGSVAELFVVFVMGFIVVLLGLQVDKDNTELRARLIDTMRDIAQKPMPDPDDGRFKRWNDVRQSFPE